MTRIRTIKPAAFTSDTLSSVPVAARWTFAGLWTYVDDDGRGRADVRLLKAALYPLDDSTSIADVEAHLRELERIGAVCRYEVEGRRLLHVPKFGEHQRINRRTDSTLPACSLGDHDGITEDSVSAHGVSGEVVHREVEVEVELGSGSGTGRAGARATAEQVVAAFCDSTPKRPPERVAHQLVRLTQEMLTEGISEADVRAGLVAWGEKGLHPNTLPSVVNEVMNRRPRSTTDQRVSDGMRLVQRLADGMDIDRRGIGS